MKALSVRQPWASAIMRLGKDVENRSWYTSHRGPLLVCAASRFDGRFDEAAWREWRKTLPPEADAKLPDSFFDFSKTMMTTSAALGTVEVVGCLANGSRSPWAVCGQWHWILRNPIPFRKTFFVRGALGLFDVSDEFVARALSQNQQETPT